jgi:hypothetical protein
MSGAVRQLIATHAPGAPAGLELLVDGPQGSFTESLGPNISREVQQNLSQGEAVQISGVFQTIDGKEYLLARNLTVAGTRSLSAKTTDFLPTRNRLLMLL